MNKNISTPVGIIIIVVIAIFVIGVVAWQSGWVEKFIPLTTNTPSAIPTSTPDETANWKTFRFDSSSALLSEWYEFKYPSNTELIINKKSKGDSVVILKPNGAIFGVGMIGSLNDNLEKYLEETSAAVPEIVYKNKINTQVDNLPAIQVEQFYSEANATVWDTYFVREYFFNDGRKGYTIFNIGLKPPEWGNGSKPTKEEVDIYNKMLSTFRFVE